MAQKSRRTHQITTTHLLSAVCACASDGSVFIISVSLWPRSVLLMALLLAVSKERDKTCRNSSYITEEYTVAAAYSHAANVSPFLMCCLLALTIRVNQLCVRCVAQYMYTQHQQRIRLFLCVVS